MSTGVQLSTCAGLTTRTKTCNPAPVEVLLEVTQAWLRSSRVFRRVTSYLGLTIIVWETENYTVLTEWPGRRQTEVYTGYRVSGIALQGQRRRWRAGRYRSCGRTFIASRRTKPTREDREKAGGVADRVVKSTAVDALRPRADRHRPRLAVRQCADAARRRVEPRWGKRH